MSKFKYYMEMLEREDSGVQKANLKMKKDILKGWKNFLIDERKLFLSNKSLEKVATYQSYNAGTLQPKEKKDAKKEFMNKFNREKTYFNNPEQEREDEWFDYLNAKENGLPLPIKKKFNDIEENLVEKFLRVKNQYVPLAIKEDIIKVLEEYKKIDKRAYWSLIGGQ